MNLERLRFHYHHMSTEDHSIVLELTKHKLNELSIKFNEVDESAKICFKLMTGKDLINDKDNTLIHYYICKQFINGEGLDDEQIYILSNDVDYKGTFKKEKKKNGLTLF